MKLRDFGLLFGILGLTPPEEAYAQDTTAAGGPVTAKFEVDGHDSAGTMKAGLMCLPRGILRVGEFLADDEELAALIRESLSEIAEDQRASLFARYPDGIVVILFGIEADLCARKWGMFGMGDTKSLSGSASFAFAWVSPVPNSSAKRAAITITVETPKDRGRMLRSITREAARLLVRQMAAR